MRGRRPRGVELKPDHIPQLEALLRSGKTEQRTARRTRVLLGIHQGEGVKPLSEKVELDPSTLWRVCRRYEERGIEAVYDAPRSGRPPEISPPGAGRIENVACTPPAEHGLELTHWSVRSLQIVVTRLPIVPTIHYTTIAEILRTATLQPHCWRYWKTTLWDAAAVRRAAKVL